MTRVPEIRALESGGHITRGGVYYSTSKPKGVLDTLVFDQDNWNLAKNLAENPNTTNEEVRKVQHWLARIGYLDKGESDGFLGQKTRGAIKRYRINFNNETTEFDMWKLIKGKFDNMFSGE